MESVKLIILPIEKSPFQNDYVSADILTHHKMVAKNGYFLISLKSKRQKNNGRFFFVRCGIKFKKIVVYKNMPLCYNYIRTAIRYHLALLALLLVFSG